MKMEAIKTETTNTIFTKEGCFDLPGTRYIYEDGTPGIETCWQLTEEEIQQVVKTGKIYVYMMGESVPPMFLATETCIEFKKDTKIHLCDTCKRSSEFPECLNDGIEFSDGHGNDNIIVCGNYEQDGEK